MIDDERCRRCGFTTNPPNNCVCIHHPDKCGLLRVLATGGEPTEEEKALIEQLPKGDQKMEKFDKIILVMCVLGCVFCACMAVWSHCNPPV